MKIGEAFIATISSIQTNRMGDRSEHFRVSATYDIGGTLGSITFDVPIEQAASYHVGQRLTLSVEVAE